MLAGIDHVRRGARRQGIVRLGDGAAIYIVLALLVLVAALGTDTFLRPLNLSNVFRQAVALGLVSLGQTLVILTGGIDMSVGALVSLSTVLAAGIMHGRPEMIAPALLAVGAAAVLTGLLNGFLVTRLRVPPFIATLGVMSAVQGATFLYTRQPVGPIAPPLRAAAEFSIGPLPLGAVMLMALVAGCAWGLRYTPLGRHLYAVGGAEDAAVLTGVPVVRVKVAAYLLSSLFAASAGIWLAARMSIGDPIVGNGFELDSITAALIGGTSLAGGRGGAIGTLGGVLVIATLNNMMNLFNISSFTQQIVKGLIIIGAVALVREHARRR